MTNINGQNSCMANLGGVNRQNSCSAETSGCGNGVHFPSPANNSPCNNLNSNNQCGKICIEANRVFDICEVNTASQAATIAVTFARGVDAQTFVNNQNDVATISNLYIVKQGECNRGRVQFNENIPLSIVALDASGSVVNGTAEVTVPMDLSMNLPCSAMTPLEVKTLSNYVIVSGTFSDNILTCQVCYRVVTKVVAPVDIFIDTDGYPNPIRVCDNLANRCSQIMKEPLYPHTYPKNC